jgi:mannose-1-phosphate guanylyltransferase
MRACDPSELWGLILAGGDGRRLRSLTTLIAGDERPKQFCPVLGNETLLDWTRRRAGLLIDPGRTVLVLTRAHQPYYAGLVRALAPRCVVAQPRNRGTAPAILYSLLRIATLSPMATVAVFPSDHYVSDDAALMTHVAAAASAVAARPDLVVLLGARATTPEREYGWIEPGEPLPVATLRRVRRFWEKPSSALAQKLLEAGSLWNTFLMVARVPAFISMVRHALPHLCEQFQPLTAALLSEREDPVAERLYARLEDTSFSDAVLALGPPNLVVLPVSGVQWSDWGGPRRVLETLNGLGIRPQWQARLEAQLA